MDEIAVAHPSDAAGAASGAHGPAGAARGRTPAAESPVVGSASAGAASGARPAGGVRSSDNAGTSAREPGVRRPAARTPAPREALRDEVVEEVRERIVSGVYRPDDRLRERALSEEFGVSRVPVREALLVLEQQRMVVNRPRIGAVVTELTAGDVEELFDVRTALEPLVAGRAARYRDDDDLAALRSHQGRATAAAARGDLRAGSLANADFHLALVAAAHSALLSDLMGPLHWQIQRLFRQTITDHELDLCSDHERVLRAVVERDAELAEFVAHRHVISTRARSIKAFTAR